ncbi:cytochrome P450 [Mycena vulgaris]|nr:cytochrome P450 [Mycena vulgaris]
MENLDAKMLLLYGLVAVVSISWLRSGEKSSIPAILGSKGVISSYLAALHWLRDATDVIHQGYYQYRDGVFRVATLFRWDFVANGPQRIAEIASAPEHILSFNEAAEDAQGSLTRNLARCFPQVRDEIVHAFDDVLALEEKEWKRLHVLPSIMQVVARTSNRLFVGLPLCRVQPIFAPLLSTRKSSLRHAMKFLGPIIEERLENEREYGRDWPDKPNDLITWLLDLAEGEERTAPAVTLRILMTNMAAIHTSSMALTAALYDLTTYPEHMLPMREEAERVVAEEGWSKATLSQRLTGVGALAMSRQVVAKDGFTFSDGTNIPYGSFMSVPGTAIHYDSDNYENAETFDGFRFSRLLFGHGRHACPGRFFAATELKAMLAHILINYDVKAETEGVRPPDQCFGPMRLPNPQGKIMIRKRVL